MPDEPPVISACAPANLFFRFPNPNTILIRVGTCVAWAPTGAMNEGKFLGGTPRNSRLGPQIDVSHLLCLLNSW